MKEVNSTAQYIETENYMGECIRTRTPSWLSCNCRSKEVQTHLAVASNTHLVHICFLYLPKPARRGNSSIHVAQNYKNL